MVVAFLPSKRPARAGIVAPLQTVIKWFNPGPIFRRYSSNSGAGSIAPQPPGTIKTSNSGAFVKVWVGRICCPTLWTPGACVETGSRDWAIMERVISWVMDRLLMTSIGPKASRASNAWKTRSPIFLGTFFR